FFQQIFSISSGRFQDSTCLEPLCLDPRNGGPVSSHRTPQEEGRCHAPIINPATCLCSGRLLSSLTRTPTLPAGSSRVGSNTSSPSRRSSFTPCSTWKVAQARKESLMATTPYAFTRGVDYPSIVATSEKVAWTVDEIFHNRRFDATKRIVPDSWVRTQHLTFLTPQDQRTLNHIRAFSYVHLFGNYEEFIPLHLMEIAQQD